MPRPERSLDPSAGPVQRLAADLRELREKAGSPAYRTLSRRCGYSVTSLSDAAGGRRLPALPVLKAYVAACDGDPVEWEERWRAVSVELAQARGEAPGPAGPPYLGLASFQPTDAARFFGRERLVEELTRRVAGGGFLAVVGASGSGKSSLVRAGLLPVLAGCERYLLFTPGIHPVGALAAAGPPAPLVLVDQFEEVFTLCRDEGERVRFVDALLDLLAADPSTKLIIALRGDFYGHCAAYPGLVAALRDGTALIGPMCDEELGRAVTGPAGLAGLSVERALVTKVVADAAGRPGALPMVSHAMLETWLQRQGKLLTLAGYAAAGGVTGALARTAEKVYDRFDETQREITRQLLTRLTTFGEGTEDTRRRVQRAELDIEGADTVIDELARARLLVVDEHTVEIAHEALIAQWPRLRGWLNEDRYALRVHRQLTEAATIWQSLDREPGALYRGARLVTAREWADRDSHATALTRLERDFLAASVGAELAERTAAERRSRQLHALTAGLAVLLVLAIVGGTAAVWQWREAVGQRQQARSRQLATESLSVARTDVAQALRLGLDAYRAAPTTQARGAVLSLASHQLYSGRLHPNGGLVKEVAFSPDGATLAVATQDGRVTLWDVARRTQRSVLTGHDRAARAVAYHPGGALLASGGLDGSVIIWDVARSGSRARLHGHRGAVDGVAFSPDGAVLASIGEDHRILLWRVADGAALGELAGHGSTSDVAFSPDGRWLVSAGDDGAAVVWDVAQRVRVRSLAAGRRPMYAVAYSPDGRRIATAGEERDISVWDAATGRQLAVLIGHTASVTALAFASDGVTLVSAGHESSASAWDVVRGGRIAVLKGHTSQLYGVAVSPDGRTIASASRDQTVQLWSREQGALTGSMAEVLDVTLSQDGRTVAAGGSDGTAVLWDSETRQRRRVLSTEEQATFPAGSSLDSQFVVTRGGNAVVLWNAVTAEPVRRFTGHTDRVLTTALQPRGPLLASGGADRRTLVWDTRSGERIAMLDQPAEVVRVAFTHDEATLVSVTRNGTVTIWDTARRSTRKVLRTGLAVTEAAVSPDGRLLALGNAAGEILLWDVERDLRAGALTGHTGPVTALTFSPTGRVLASGGQDRTVRMWDVPRRRLSATLIGHESGVSAATWSPAGDVLYTGGVDHVVIPWTVDPARALARICRDLPANFPDEPKVDCPRSA